MKIRTAARIVFCGLSLAALAGCMGHGDYTKKGLNAAETKLRGVKAATEYQMAEQAFMAGELEKADKHTQLSIAQNDSVAKTYVLLGRVRMEKGDLEQALLALQKAESLDPKHVDAQYYQGVLYERFAQKDRAIEKYRLSAELDPSNAQYPLAAAEVMMDQNKLDDAKSYLTQKLSYFEHNAGLHQTLGHIATIQERHDDAVNHFSQARLLSPDDLGIQEDLARAQVQTQAWAQAESILSRLSKNADYKGRRDVQLLRVECLVKLDRALDARSILLDVTREGDGANDAEAWIALGNVSYMLKDWHRLKQCGSRSVNLAPKRPEGYLLRALSLRQAKQFDAAETSIRQALRLGESAEAFTLLAMVQQDAGKMTLAHQSFDKAKALEAKDQSRRNATVPEPAGE